ncbi:hypothetical protein, partial [Acinetobacter guillouiae]|uniref:hypothetical protein n=1 Tax=Acinetobacter guillouiae TaxID=106649 RepID=UPI0026E3A6AE
TMEQAIIAITGKYVEKPIKKLHEKKKGNWKSKQPYQRLSTEITTYKAQKVHALSDQLEFGSNQALQTITLGEDNKYAAALIVFS